MVQLAGDTEKTYAWCTRLLTARVLLGDGCSEVAAAAAAAAARFRRTYGVDFEPSLIQPGVLAAVLLPWLTRSSLPQLRFMSSFCVFFLKTADLPFLSVHAVTPLWQCVVVLQKETNGLAQFPVNSD